MDEPVAGPADLTWAALLAHWTEFARSALALPREGEGGRWRAAVAPLIGLQAITFALADLDRLPDAERAAGFDRAEVLIRRYERELRDIWRGLELPGEAAALVDDARRALAAAQSMGLEWRLKEGRLVSAHPAELAETLVASGFKGDLYLPVGHESLFAPAPVAFARQPNGVPVPAAVRRAVEAFFAAPLALERRPGPRQVYRQFDFGTGQPTRDLVVPMDAPTPPGRPLLAPAILAGQTQPVPLLPRPQELPPIPVVFGQMTSAGHAAGA